MGVGVKPTLFRRCGFLCCCGDIVGVVFGFLDFWGLARGSRVEMFRCGRCWFGVFGLCAGICDLLLLSLASANC